MSIAFKSYTEPPFCSYIVDHLRSIFAKNPLDRPRNRSAALAALVISEGYATAATIAKQGKVAALAAYPHPVA